MNRVSRLFRFSDFTLENYAKLLKIAKEHYQFILFSESEDRSETKSILLRHDVEFSVHIAKEMAKIENCLGIKATYFIQLHGDFYNALENNTFKLLKEIESLGHDLQLHFDVHFWGLSNEKQLEKCLNIDKKTFKLYFRKEPSAFSFHNTNFFTISCEKDYYARMINVYSKRYKNNIGYISDSTGYWRFEVLEERLLEAKECILQILIHDGMWQDIPLPPRQRIFKIIEQNAERLRESYDETLKKFGAKNIDWEGEI